MTAVDMPKMNMSQNIEKMTFAELGPIAERFDEQALQCWALQRVYHILTVEPDNCLAELQRIAEWVRQRHPEWMKKDKYWAEFVRINARPRRARRWLSLLGF